MFTFTRHNNTDADLIRLFKKLKINIAELENGAKWRGQPLHQLYCLTVIACLIYTSYPT